MGGGSGQGRTLGPCHDGMRSAPAFADAGFCRHHAVTVVREGFGGLILVLGRCSLAGFVPSRLTAGGKDAPASCQGDAALPALPRPPTVFGEAPARVGSLVRAGERLWHPLGP